MLKFKAFFMIILGIGLISCVQWSEDTETSLDYAKGNWEELEKVLIYYHEIDPNPKKLEAAEFLIVNMTYYFSNFREGVDSLDISCRYTYRILHDNRIDVLVLILYSLTGSLT